MQILSIELLLALSATFCFGLGVFLSSKVAKGLGPVQTLFLFQLFGMPALFLFLPFAPQHMHVQWIPLILLGIFQALNMLIWFYALKVGNVSIVSPVSEVYSLISVVLGVIFLHETVGFIRIVGIGLIFSGVILLGIQLDQLRKTKTVSLYKGITPAFIYAIGLAVFIFFSVLSARTNGWFISAFGLRGVIVMCTLVLLLLQGKTFKSIFHNIPWAWIVSAGMVDAIGFSVFSLASVHTDVSYLAVISSAQSLVVVVLAYLFYKERLKLYQIVGLFAVVAGLIFLQLH